MTDQTNQDLEQFESELDRLDADSMFEDMNFAKMVEEGKPIYVINRSARVLGKAHLLVLNFPNPAGGRGKTVKLPPTKYPVNLSRRVAPPQAIPMSTDFVDWVNRGVIEVVTPEQAREVLSDPEARASVKEAFAKLSMKKTAHLGAKPKFNVKHGGDRTTRSVGYPDEDDLSIRHFQGSTPEEAHVSLEEMASPQEGLRLAAKSANVSAKIERFCAELLEDPSLKKGHLRTFKSWDEMEASDAELGFILDKLGHFEGIAAYAKSLMAQRAGGKKGSGKKGRRKKGAKKNQSVDDWTD